MHARAVSVRRSPRGDDEGGPIYIPPGRKPHTPCYPPGQCGGQLHADDDDKRRKRSLDGEPEPQRIEKRNLFSRLLNTGSLHRTTYPRVQNSNSNSNNNNRVYQSYGDDNESNEEYLYWRAEEEEGIDEEDDLERHGGIYEDVDEDEGEDGIVVMFGDVTSGTVKQPGASTSIVIEPFPYPAAAGLFDSKDDGQMRENSNTASTAAARDDDNDRENDEDTAMDMDRIRANHPWYHNQQHPSSPSDYQETDNIIKSLTWIVDEWDEDLDGVEDEILDDLTDWIDNLDHVRARSAAPNAGSSAGSSYADASGSEGIVLNQLPLRSLFH
ncbi:hypothetical protein EC991_000473 [Linnemannia zychae]|nr:hypothetical protein EC991_000473 [Linnemannia zychae]